MTEGGAVPLPFIDTSAKGNGTAAAVLPQNGVTPETMELQLDASFNVIFDQNGTLQQIYLPKERQFNPLGDLTL